MKETQRQYLKRKLRCQVEVLRKVNVSSTMWHDFGAALIDFVDALLSYLEENLNEEEV